MKHPNIVVESILDTMRSIDRIIIGAFDYFGLNISIRNRGNISSYRRLHDSFMEIGLLKDLNLRSPDNSIYYIKLCLARAEICRLNNINLPNYFPKNIKLKDLPLGPVEKIKFQPDNYLDLPTNKIETDFKNRSCSVCLKIIGIDESVLNWCNCFSLECCPKCARLQVSALWNTYHSPIVPSNCLVCRQPSYFIVTNTSKAIIEEEILIKKAFYRMEENVSMAGARLLNLFKMLNTEAMKKKFPSVNIDKETDEILLETYDKSKNKQFYPLRCWIARLQVRL